MGMGSSSVPRPTVRWRRTEVEFDARNAVGELGDLDEVGTSRLSENRARFSRNQRGREMGL